MERNPIKDVEFMRDLTRLINLHSMEQYSDTPDFILAEYLLSCLRTFDATTHHRTEWYK